jgi:photosystem II stability/assembly factor-like uncharacterized protein
MKKLIFLITLISISFTYTSYTFPQTNWIQQNSGTNETLWSIDMIDANTGYIACSGGLVLKTINGGINWSSHQAGSNNLIGIDFIDNMTGWVSGHNGTISKTTNGGLNWTNQNSPTNLNLFFVQFLNEHTGYISSDAGVLKTTNGGEQWFYSFYSSDPVYAVYFLNENTGWFGNNIGNQFLSSNGGVHWLYTQNVPATGNIAYYFIDENTGWSVGYNNRIIKTTNGGYDWERQLNGLSDYTQLRDVEFINNSSGTGWIVGLYNTVLKTENGGNNWQSQSMPVNGDFTAVKFINSKTGWIIGMQGIILKTVDEGLTNLNNTNISDPVSFELFQNYPNPFNPTTSIKFSIPNSGNISLKVYDRLGKEVAELADGFRSAGTYEINFDASHLSSGIYFYKLVTNNLVNTKKMTLIK